MKLWLGKEQEGNFEGMYTLFIGSPTIEIEDIDKVYNEKIKQFYFGAGKCSKINEHLVQECVGKYKDVLITIEVDIKHLNDYDILEFANNIIISVTNKNFHLIKYLENVQLKVQTLVPKENTNIYLTDFNNFNEVNKKLEGKIYKGDVILK